MDITREQRQIALKKLPQETRDFLFSDECIQAIESIGKKYNLLLDKVGELEDKIFLVIYGLIPANEFVGIIEAKLNLSEEDALRIGEEVNTLIFLKIRNILQDKPVESLKEIAKIISVSEPSRDSILAEIENPTPTIHPISAVDQTVAGPALAREVIPETASTVAHDFIGSKLTETVSLPSQKAAVTLKTPEVKPKSYAADPYREAIN